LSRQTAVRQLPCGAERDGCARLVGGPLVGVGVLCFHVEKLACMLQGRHA